MFLKKVFIKWLCLSFVRANRTAVSWLWAFFFYKFKGKGVSFWNLDHLSSYDVLLWSPVQYLVPSYVYHLLWDDQYPEKGYYSMKEEWNWCYFYVCLGVFLWYLLMFFFYLLCKRKLRFQCSWLVVCILLWSYSTKKMWMKCFDKCVIDLCITRIWSVINICFSSYLFKLSDSVFICSPEARGILFISSFACLRLLIIKCLLKFAARRSPDLFISSGKYYYHCCAGPMRAVCIMAIRFKIQASWHGESVCSVSAFITIFAVLALNKSSVV